MTAGVQARVLIVARDDALAGPLAEGLDRLGWRTVTARGPYAALAALGDLTIEAAIIDLASGGHEALTMARRLKAAYGARRLPVIAIGDPSPELETYDFDLTVAAPLHPAQAATRLETLVRTAVAEEEFELRLATFADRGRQLDRPEVDTSPFQVLAIGEPAPQFLALANALTRSSAEVVGAFTAYTAFDYLHERPFDAVVLWAGDIVQYVINALSPAEVKAKTAYMPSDRHEEGIIPDLTVRENVSAPLFEHTHLSRDEIGKLADLKIAMVGLPARAGALKPLPGQKRN